MTWQLFWQIVILMLLTWVIVGTWIAAVQRGRATKRD